MQPNLGLVCITHCAAVRYRPLSLSRYRYFPASSRAGMLEDLYRHNLKVLIGAIQYCAEHGIALYRIPSSLFPLYDLPDSVGLEVVEDLRPDLAWVGRHAAQTGVRLVTHPTPLVMLDSLSDTVIENSIQALETQAQLLDWMGLPKSVWAAFNIHGGKTGRGEKVVESIRHLSDSVRSRLTLENDESAYGAAEILEVCREAHVPMVFDVHHHVVREGLKGYEDPSIAHYTALAAQTWPQPEWQIVHLSNGRSSLLDHAHHNYVQAVPSSFYSVPWIEVEAKLKEQAIAALLDQWATLFNSPHFGSTHHPTLGGQNALE